MKPKKYSDAFREQFLREVNRPGGPGPYALADQRGLSHGTVYRWLQAANKLGRMTEKPRRPEDLSPDEKLRILAESARVSDADLGAFLRRHGVHEADLSRWRTEALVALGGGSGKAQPPSKRIRALERELARKEKALAEAAALLVLAKKARALLGDEDDDTGEE